MSIGWLLISCSSPAKKYSLAANKYHFISQRVVGNSYHHRVFRNFSQSVAPDLHVYLDSDGTPWKFTNQIALDPTPREHILLKLMSQDNHPSILLGRPCYHDESQSSACNPLMWTFARYSEEVVQSMQTALRNLMIQFSTKSVTFVGYSGGGVIALLLASRFQETVNVITIAANLNSDAWTALHGYTPLFGSKNPSLMPVLDSSIRQLHLSGGMDSNVPFRIVEEEIVRQRAQFRIYPTFTHHCCWENVWTDILEMTNLKQSEMNK